MKITTRIILGYGVLATLLASLVAYEVYTINGLQAINRSLSNANVETAVACLQLWRDSDVIKEITQKAFVVSDNKGYLAQLKEYQNDFERTLRDMPAKASSAEERVEIDRLAENWRSFTVELERQRGQTVASSSAPPELLAKLAIVDTQIQSVYQANLKSVRDAGTRTNQAGELARLISFCAAAIALVISALVSFLIYRSISNPLAHLTEGTRAIAEGKFYYRLDTSRKDEFSQLARDFNTMTLRLNELDELKKAFVSHVSHELKAPLASMRETIQLILDGIPGPLTDKQRRLLDLNLQSGRRLTAMISNLLDLSRIEAGVMEYELKSRDLVPLVRHSIAELEYPAREKNMKVEPELSDQPILVECDGDRIIQVMVNLIGNAVKFSPPGGSIKVGLRATRELPVGTPESKRLRLAHGLNTNGFAQISVSDCGPGVPAAERERIFERFRQVRHSGKSAGHGVGLGLAICRTIVEAHRGAIWVEDNPPRGSVFRVILRVGSPGDSVVRRASSPI
jgi:two-component system sensor histidine kinase GlrK